MQIKKDAKIIGIWGGRGSGKSTRAKFLAKHYQRLIVIDPAGDYWGKDYIRCKNLNDVLKAIKLNWARDFKIYFDISHADDYESELLALSRALFIVQKPYFAGRDRRKMCLICDEMSLTAPNQKKAKGSRDFLKLVNLGRHYGLEIIGISQRPAQVDTDFRSNCAENYFFRLADHNDISAVKSTLGSLAESCTRLEPHNFYYKDDMGKIVKGKNILKP